MKRAVIFGMLLLVFLPVFSQEAVRPWFLDNAQLIVEPQAVSTVSSDICPVFVDGELYFSSVREEWFNKRNLENRNKAFYDIYKVKLDERGHIQTNRELVPGFGENYHEGPVSWCSGTGELFVTVSNVELPDTLSTFFPSAQVRLRLIIMKQAGGKWVHSEEFPFTDERYNYGHPAINPTGDTLVFSSDMEGGYGKSDLYYTVRKNGSWSTPVNLGGYINTIGEEQFPSFIPGRGLVFSSTGRGGYGNLDMFYVPFPAEFPVLNLGDILNSEYDDFGLTLSPDGETAYFSSDRPGKGKDDIYRLDIVRKDFLLRGKVTDRLSGAFIEGAEVKLMTCNGAEKGTSFSGTGGFFEMHAPYLNCLKLVVSHNGYQKRELEFDMNKTIVEVELDPLCGVSVIVVDYDTGRDVSGANVRFGSSLVPERGMKYEYAANCGEELKTEVTAPGYLNYSGYFTSKPMREIPDTVVLMRNEPQKSYVLKNIYYEYDSWDINAASARELDKLVTLLQDNPELHIELSSHTDSRGSSAYNLNLSKRRAIAAVEYLAGKGISPGRLSAEWYGETRLLNDCLDGIECSEAQHRENRRTEFSITE
ncbi:MAG: OmpA family protein [Mariniphaga sp.]